jgi:hypothetical protein
MPYQSRRLDKYWRLEKSDRNASYKHLREELKRAGHKVKSSLDICELRHLADIRVGNSS